MKNHSLIGLFLLCLGIAIGWFIKPDAAVQKAAAEHAASEKKTPPVSKSASATLSSEAAPVPGKRAQREPVVKKISNMPSDADMEQGKKMQAEMTKAMVSRQRTKLEQHIERLAETLHLTADQKAKLVAGLDESMKKFEGLDFSNLELSSASIADLSKSLSEKAIDEQLASSLTADQTAAFDAYKEKDHQTKVDSLALKNLSQLQGIVQFEDGQRDAVYKILTNAADEKLAREQSNPSPTDMFTSGMGIEMDPYDLGIAQALTESMENQGKDGNSGDPKDYTQMMRDVIDQRIAAKVDQLRPVLNDKQLEQYRAELKAKGAGVFGNAVIGMGGSAGFTTTTINSPAK